MSAPLPSHSYSSHARLALILAGLLAMAMLLSACGFRMRGTTDLPYERIYTNVSDNSAFGAHLRRSIRANAPDVQFVSEPRDAQVQLIQEVNRERRRELSIDASGHVEEYELILEFAFRITDRDGRVLLPTTTLTSSREIPYDSEDSQARRGEMRMIFQDMRQSMVDRIVRQLSASEVSRAYEEARQEAEETDTTDEFDTSMDSHGSASD